jgi:hypothetical protein
MHCRSYFYVIFVKITNDIFCEGDSNLVLFAVCLYPIFIKELLKLLLFKIDYTYIFQISSIYSFAFFDLSVVNDIINPIFPSVKKYILKLETFVFFKDWQL